MLGHEPDDIHTLTNLLIGRIGLLALLDPLLRSLLLLVVFGPVFGEIQSLTLLRCLLGILGQKHINDLLLFEDPLHQGIQEVLEVVLSEIAVVGLDEGFQELEVSWHTHLFI